MRYMGMFAVVAMLLLSGCSPNSAERSDHAPPETVEEERVVITDPESAEYVQRKTDELAGLLKTLKAYGAKMEGYIEFPQINGRSRVIDLDRDVRVPAGAPELDERIPAPPDVGEAPPLPLMTR